MKAVILAGGAGSRLWPMSRDLKPKQFHAFVGKKTMLQQAYERLSFLPKKDIFVATNFQYENLLKKQLPELADSQIIIEPALRDTGPCICFAASLLAKRGFGNEAMAIIYADQLIQNREGFEEALRATVSHVEKKNALAVIAVRAKSPNPNLGYIRIGKLLQENKDGLEIYELDRFVEKPDVETAKKFLSSYKYLWNTGLYVWRVDTILKKFRKFAPEIFDAVVTKNAYESAPKISIDYAVMEKIAPSEVHVVPADLGWNDIGNWAALHEELASNQSENVGLGEFLALDTEGSVVLANSGKLVVTYGVKDLVVVDTPEALLVMPKSKAAEVKKIIEEVKRRKKGKVL